MMPRFLPLALFALLVWAPVLEAQGPPGNRPPGGGRPLRVQAQQGLVFGTLLPGVPQQILPGDALNAASAEISGQGRSDVLVSFLLPTQLDGPGGGAIPLTFGASSAGYSPTRDIGAQIAFDPEISQVLALPQNGRGMVYLGGTALPPPQLPAGAYTGTVTLTVSYLGS